MENGFSIAMTPLQLAAVMADESVLTERIWGSIGFLGSVLELASATALCLVPEPTGVTKAGCIIVGAHSLDGISSSAYQVYSGKPTASMTARATAGIARELGADKSTADQIGIAVDVILPFSVAGAARVASVRMGQVKLMSHEAVKGTKVGGHTLKKHTGKSFEDLSSKIDHGLKSGTLDVRSFASSFPSIEIAERAVSQTIKANRSAIRLWAKNTSTGGKNNFLRIEHVSKSNVGIVVSAVNKEFSETKKLRVVLLKEEYNKKTYYILTAYPIK
ncbi:RNase A-like domain-containing protein [Pseudomonas graminis]